MADQNSGLSYFIVGLGVGVALGLLLAPRSGEETRRLLREKAEEGTGYLRTRAEEGKEFVRRRSTELKDSAAEAIERSKDALLRQKDQLAMAVEAGKQAYRESVSES
ncbi:MAG: YtxH domain-containing protein [Acidobacteria bacterium]|nr:YtxH domain-containing protein [Acidobacteriota bacterium]MBI3472636.1 YtxH domain-containing protein [Candidatus Solibacter usitatus]